MTVNLVLAALMSGIVAYTDLKVMKIYNKHMLIFFVSGLCSVLIQQKYDLFLSAGLILTVYLFFYYGNRFISRIALSMGLMPLPEGAKPIAGGDLKLAVTLALLLGHYPVLYGSLIGIMLLVVWQGVKRWAAIGSIQGVADVALGRVHTPAPFGPWLGFCSLGAAFLAQYSANIRL